MLVRAIDQVVNLFNPVSFAKSMGFYPDKWQQKFLLSSDNREMLCWTRQGGKSTITALKAYFLAKTRKGLGIIISPSERQSKELVLKIKDFISRDKDAPKIVGRGSKTELQFESGGRIVALPANSDTIRGFSAPDWLLFDEAAMCPDEVFNSVMPMLATSSKRSKVFLISTPKGKRGFFYDLWIDEDNGWSKMMVKATDINRISPEYLEEIRRDLGSEKWFKQEFMCEFLNVNESLFDMDEIMGAFTGSSIDLEMEKKTDVEFTRTSTLSERFPWLNALR